MHLLLVKSDKLPVNSYIFDIPVSEEMLTEMAKDYFGPLCGVD